MTQSQPPAGGPGRDRFSVRQAITQPFRMPGGRHFLIRLLLWASAFILLIYYFLGQEVLSVYIEAFINLSRVENSEDREAVSAALAPISTLSGSVYLISGLTWIVLASAETAFHKNHLRGIDPGLFPLRFGLDEIRVMVAQIIVWSLSYGVLMLGSMLTAYVAGLGVISAQGGPSALSSILSVLATFGSVVFLWVSLILCVRLSPAAALSVRDRAFRTFQGWAVTRGPVGPLIASYVLVAILGYITLAMVMAMGLLAVIADSTVIESLGASTNGAIKGAVNDWDAVMSRPGVVIAAVFSVMAFMTTCVLWCASFWGIGNYVTKRNSASNA